MDRLGEDESAYSLKAFFFSVEYRVLVINEK